MKCMIKDKKVLQAITIGLAAAITATSMPVSVYADDENISTINTENSNENNENTNTQSEENLISEVAGNCADIINENGQSSEVKLQMQLEKLYLQQQSKKLKFQ